jgi:ribonuclease HI
MNHSRSN